MDTHLVLTAPMYLLQQLINAVTVSCIYGLLAIGYTLIYSLVGRINLAFGDLATLGAYMAFLGVTLLALKPIPTVLMLGLVAGFAMLNGALAGWLVERWVFRPLAASRSQAPLIATIGLAIVVQETLRFVYGANNYWLPPLLSDPWILARNQAFSVSVTTLQLLIVGVTAAAFIALMALMYHSRFGRQHRACADDPGMAALCGVNVSAIVIAAFMLSTAYAGLAGYWMTLQYGVVNFYMGLNVGLKALTAAVVGGIGSLPGALLGSFVIGALETLWSAYLSIEYKDMAVFAMLIAFLVLRPHGLLGQRG